MAVPDYQSVMLPLLEYAASSNGEITIGSAVDALAASLGLTEDDLKQMLPSDIQQTFVNRVGWATTYMKKAGLLEATRRGYYRITQRGLDLLEKKP
jgi:restriction system protein